MIGIETRTLRCELTKQEIDERASALARTVRDQDEIEGQKKASATHFKDQIEDLRLKANTLAHEVSEGATYRAVDCRSIRNELNQTMQLIRTDTGVVVETRPMTREEKQQEMFPDGAPEIQLASPPKRERKQKQKENVAE